ncbi:MAG: FkbM family methyltransferase [Sedimentisphaerales bacterium]|nr:FkbM family methyltransferase [Sedimentisphaerales bacterium]
MRIRSLMFRLYCAVVRKSQITTTIDNIRYHLDLGEMIDLCLYLDRYEPDVTGAIERFCKPGHTVLDIGANIGAHTLRMARNVGPNGQVYAFEPTDYAFQKLLQNIALNHFSNIETCKLALSDQNLPAQQVNFRASWRTDGTYKDTTCQADFKRLDDWVVEKNVQHVDLVKLDVDGHEYAVLTGGEYFFRDCRPLLIIEVVDWHFKKVNRNPLKLLQEWGYRFWNLHNNREYRTLEEVRKDVPTDWKTFPGSISELLAAVELDREQQSMSKRISTPSIAPQPRG